MKKVFITGGTGFIGSHFINELQKNNIKVKALRRSYKSKLRFPLLISPEWITKNITDLTVEDLLDCDLLIHLAAHSANIPYDNLENCILENAIKPLRLLGIAHKAGINKFLIAGTCFEYGKSGENYKLIPSDASLNPTQTYPASKAISSIAFSQFAREYKVSLSYQRIFQVYGEGEMQNRLWPSLKFAAENNLDFDMTKGEQIRDFIYVKDLAKILYKKSLLLNENIKPEVVIENISGGNPKLIKDFAKEWWSLFNAKGKLNIGVLPYRKGEVMRYVPEIDNNFINQN
mgnify:CR=1 FL=1